MTYYLFKYSFFYNTLAHLVEIMEDLNLRARFRSAGSEGYDDPMVKMFIDCVKESLKDTGYDAREALVNYLKDWL